jgi:Zn-dependent protease
MLLFDLFNNPFAFIFFLIAIVIAITVHEFAHAYVTDYLGDPTPSLQGRITLNPAAHIDPTGMIFLLFFGFGWGRPVQFDPFNLKDPRKDAAIIAVAGPASNVILAIISSVIAYVFVGLIGGSILIDILYSFLRIFITLNLFLAFFNLIPVHPFDGFKIVGGLLPKDKAYEWYQLERYGFLFLILLIVPFGGQSMAGTIVNFFISPLLGIFIP